jgi:hypothetical protein
MSRGERHHTGQHRQSCCDELIETEGPLLSLETFDYGIMTIRLIPIKTPIKFHSLQLRFMAFADMLSPIAQLPKLFSQRSVPWLLTRRREKPRVKPCGPKGKAKRQNQRPGRRWPSAQNTRPVKSSI